jgi:Undecaprenyl-phosphate galactose phosphotransferase WbaP
MIVPASPLRILTAPFQARVIVSQVATDLVVLAGCTWAAIGLRELVGLWFPITMPFGQAGGLFLAMLLIPIGLLASGSYPGYGQRGVERMRRRLRVVAATAVLAGAFDYLVQDNYWSRGVLVAGFTLAMVAIPVADALLREVLVAWRWWGLPVVLVGDSGAIRRTAALLADQPHTGYRPVGALVGDGGEVPLPVFADAAAARAAAGPAAAAVVALDRGGDPAVAQADLAGLPFYRTIIVPDGLPAQTLWVDARDLGGVLGLEVRRNLLRARNRVVKKAMDLVLIGPCFLAAAPVIAFFALVIKVVDRGPAFYAQEREGRDGRTIRVWKLRSMVVDSQARLERHLAEHPEARAEWDRFCKLRDDPRILPWIGRFIRTTSIDELPQLWNVVRGDLSLVGPRPFPRYHLEKFPPGFRALRASVMPGITGLWQVSDRSEADLVRQEALDTYYIRNWSPWMDLQLLARTPWVLLFKRGGAR